MIRSLVVAVSLAAFAATAAGQKPHAAGHAAKPAAPPAHKAAPLPVGKGGGGANATDAQLKAIEKQTAKTATVKPAKQKGAGAPKVKPVGAKKNPPIAFKAQHVQGAKHAGAAPKNAVHAKH